MLVLLKAVDVAVRGPLALPAGGWVAALAVFVAGGSALLVGPLVRVPARTCWAAVLAGAVGIAVDLPLELRLQHLVLVMGVALAACVSRYEQERLLLWRVQLSALYGTAALAKLNESFLSGDVLAGAVLRAPFWSQLLPAPPLSVLLLAGAALVLTEVALAVTPWVPRLRRAGAGVALAFHSATLLLVSDSPVVGLRLVVFGGTAVLLHATSAGLLPSWSARSRSGRLVHVP
ncbi:MAG: hypothetical protein ABR614_02250 [Mycobacteriales bacterium]